MRTETWSGNKGKTILRNFPFWSRDLGSWKEFKWAFGPLKPDGEENCVATCTPLYEEVCEHNDEFPENVYAPECKNVLVGFECFEYCWSSPVEPEDPCPWGDCEEECPYGDCDEGPFEPDPDPDPEPEDLDSLIKEFCDNLTETQKTTIKNTVSSLKDYDCATKYMYNHFDNKNTSFGFCISEGQGSGTYNPSTKSFNFTSDAAAGNMYVMEHEFIHAY
jgi:hypothetical protein